MEKLNSIMMEEDFVMLAVNTEQDGRRTVPEFLMDNQHCFKILYDDTGVVQQLKGVTGFPSPLSSAKTAQSIEKSLVQSIGPTRKQSPISKGWSKNNIY